MGICQQIVTCKHVCHQCSPIVDPSKKIQNASSPPQVISQTEATFKQKVGAHNALVQKVQAAEKKSTWVARQPVKYGVYHVMVNMMTTLGET